MFNSFGETLFKCSIDLLCPSPLYTRTNNANIKRILSNSNIEFEQQYMFKGLKSIRRLKCDFYLPNHKVVIEFNGRQHYEPVKVFGGKTAFIESQKRDEIKRLFLRENNIRLLEIHYEAINLEELVLNFIT
jgi:very-short-patch-repair endonuclease